MIPNAALAAMLIAVGIKLAHPKEFIHTYKIGNEQLAIFLTTIFFTLFEDLLIGIAAGMALKLVIHIFHGASWKGLFKAGIRIEEEGEMIHVYLQDAAVFTNYLGIKAKLDALPPERAVCVHFENATLVDHSVMENLHHFQQDYISAGGQVVFQQMEQLEAFSNHPLAARKIAKIRFPSSKDSLLDGSFNEEEVLHDLRHYLPAQASFKG